jgi:hypothetical protein
LLDQAGLRPLVPLTDDPDLHLMIDGIRLDATTRTDVVYVFNLRHAPKEIRLASRSSAPQELGLARDPRCLGIAVQRLVLRQRKLFRTFPADDPRLAEGLHPFEAETGLRWTDGDALLPLSLFAGLTLPLELVVALACTTQYIDDGPAWRAA